MDWTQLLIVIIGGLIGITNTAIIVMSKRKRNIYTDIQKDIEKLEKKVDECIEKVSYVQGRLNGEK